MAFPKKFTHNTKLIMGFILNKFRGLNGCSKAKKLTIILTTYISIILYKILVIFLVHHNNVYEFTIEKFEAHLMKVSCGFKDATSPLNVKVENFKIEIFSQDLQEKNIAAVFRLNDFLLNKSESIVLLKTKIIIDRINNSLLFDMLTKRKPNIIVKVRAKISPRFSGIRFKGMQVERQTQFSMAKNNQPPACSVCKNFTLVGEDNGQTAMSVTINKEYFSFPLWFNLDAEKSTIIFKNPKMEVTFNRLMIVNGFLTNDIQCDVKTATENTNKIVQPKNQIYLEVYEYQGPNEYFKIFFKHMTINLDLNNKSDDTNYNPKNSTYYFKMINYDTRILSLQLKIQDDAKLNQFFKQFENFESSGLKFCGNLNDKHHILNVSLDVYYNTEISANIRIEIIDIKRFIEFFYFKQSFLSIKFAEKTAFGKVLCYSCLVIDANGMFEIVNDITKFSYSEESKRRESKVSQIYNKNVIYNFDHYCTSEENNFNIYSTMNLGSYFGTQSHIILEFEKDMSFLARTKKFNAIFKICCNSRIDVKHPNMTNEKLKEYVPFFDLLTGQFSTQLTIVSNQKTTDCNQSEAIYTKRQDGFSFEKIKSKKDAILKAFFCKNGEIDIEGCKFNFSYLLDIKKMHNIKEQQSYFEKIKILDLTNYNINKNVIEIDLRGFNENLDATGSDSIPLNHSSNNQHAIKHLINIDQEMEFRLLYPGFCKLKIEPCAVEFMSSKNGVHNIKCTEIIEIVINDNLNLYEFIHHIKRIDKNDIISTEDDALAISEFICKAIKAFVFVGAETKYNNNFWGESSVDINLRTKDSTVIFDFSLIFCEIIKSKLAFLHKSMSIEIPPFSLIFDNDVGHLEFSGVSICYDNTTQKTSVSDFKLCVNIDIKAINEEKDFNIYWQKKDIRSNRSFLKDFIIPANFSKVFTRKDDQINGDYDDIDKQIIIDSACITEHDDYDLFKLDGKLSDSGLYSFMQKIESGLFGFFKFRPARLFFNVNIEKIPLATIVSGQKPNSQPIEIRKMTLKKQILNFHEKKNSYCDFSIEVSANTKKTLIQYEIEFQLSEFLYFVNENQKMKFSRRKEPIVCFYPHRLHDHCFLLLRIDKIIKFNCKICIAYTNCKNRTFIIDLSDQKEFKNHYWFSIKLYDHNKASYFDCLFFWRYFWRNHLKQKIKIWIDNQNVHNIDLLNPEISFAPRRCLGFLLQSIKCLRVHMSNFIINYVLYYFTRNLLYEDPPYTEEELINMTKKFDDLVKQCLEA